MKKIILWSVVLILIIGMAGAAFWWLRRPQIITLSDGTKLTLLGVDYGKHHKFPTVKTTGRRMNGGGGTIDTTNDTLVVWILSEHKANQWPNYQVVVYDKAETACVTSQSSESRQVKEGMEIMGIQLNAFPRRDSKMILRIMNYGQRGEQIAKGQFIVSNPARGKTFPRWTAESLPDLQSDGDLDVTLTQLAADAPSPYNRGNGIPKNDPINKTVQLAFDLRQKGQSATNWQPVSVETSDATGNNVKGWINRNYRNGQSEGYFYQPGLWPNEPAWKVRLEFSRSGGFDAGELWSVTNIPVRAGSQQDVQNYWSWNNQNSRRTNTAFAETTINGIHVKLFPVIEYTNPNQFNGNNGRSSKVVSVILRTDPDPETSGMRMTPLAITDDQGHELHSQGSSWGGGNYQYEFPAPRAGTQSLNVTIALHQSRFVEFTVKPQKAAATGP
jgi:hypothetical protein